VLQLLKTKVEVKIEYLVGPQNALEELGERVSGDMRVVSESAPVHEPALQVALVHGRQGPPASQRQG